MTQTTRGLTRSWLAAKDAVANLEAQLLTARAEVAEAEVALAAALQERNSEMSVVVVDDRVVMVRFGVPVEGALVPAEEGDEVEP